MEEGWGAIILAGGKSARMGQDKGLMSLKGKPMISWVIETVAQLTPHIIIIANEKEYEQFGYPVFPDEVENSGPLAGLVTGLKNTLCENNWVLTCDAPYVRVDLLKKLQHNLVDFEAIIPKFNGRLYPLTAAYKKSTLPVLQSQLNMQQLKMITAIDPLNIRILEGDDEEPANFINLNSPEDL
jgi:molybdopterin-guanine dinucleotide biosynthesis protein A